jgi:hypothetical protein
MGSTNTVANQSSLIRVQPSIKIWSAFTTQVIITDGAADKALGDIVIAGLPAGVTVTRALVYVKFRTIENTNAAVNSLSGAQNFQVQKAVGGSYATGIAFAGGELALIATSGQIGGDVLMGTTDVSAQVPANGATMNAKFTSALAAEDGINLNDVQWGIEIWFTV